MHPPVKAESNHAFCFNVWWAHTCSRLLISRQHVSCVGRSDPSAAGTTACCRVGFNKARVFRNLLEVLEESFQPYQARHCHSVRSILRCIDDFHSTHSLTQKGTVILLWHMLTEAQFPQQVSRHAPGAPLRSRYASDLFSSAVALGLPELSQRGNLVNLIKQHNPQAFNWK